MTENSSTNARRLPNAIDPTRTSRGSSPRPSGSWRMRSSRTRRSTCLEICSRGMPAPVLDAPRVASEKIWRPRKGALGELKELRTFADINRTKGKHLHSLQWHPSRKGVVAVGPRSNATFEDDYNRTGFSSSSHVLYWDFADLITPLLVLESPYSVEAFAISRRDPISLLAAWRTARCWSGTRRMQRRPSTRSDSGRNEEVSRREHQRGRRSGFLTTRSGRRWRVRDGVAGRP